MPSVNKASLREELDLLKEQLNVQISAGKMSPEVQGLVKALLAMVSILVAVFMEKTTKKTSKNSSLPSSQTGSDESSLSKGAKGKGPKQNRGDMGNTRTVKTTEPLPVDQCKRCGRDLKNETCISKEKRVKIDIIFEKNVDEKVAEVKVCPDCKTQTKADFPSEYQGPLQYGIGVKAYVLNLLMTQMVSLNRIQKMMKTLIDVSISEATILKYVLQLHQSLEKWEASAIDQLMIMPTLHADETSIRVNKKNHWVHVCSGGDITLKRIHTSRGKEAIEDIGIIPKYDGVVIHDCWQSYLSYDHCGHGLCGSHLLRELTFIVDTNGYSWAKNMKKALLETCREVSIRENKRLDKREYMNLQKRYRNILTRGEKELPEIPPKPSGKRGKVAKSDAHNLWERLRDHECAVLLFAKETHVPFTNNRAERDLRMGKVKQKVSGCFREEIYAHAYCRISSYLQTMAAKGQNPLVAIQSALVGDMA
jgi:transposase